MKKTILSLSGLFLAVYGIVSAVLYSNVNWYRYFVIGGTLFLAWLNDRLKNDSLFEKKGKALLKSYGLYLCYGIIIEVIGMAILKLWHYPSFGLAEFIINVILIAYPFAFFFIYESFKLMRVSNLALAIGITSLINAFLHEVPNTFAHNWIYTIPYIKLEILQINIVVIVGWVILILLPVIAQKIWLCQDQR
ncbi:hypothetical protein DRJ25_03750 [Candidatus Woesearchaeota archaeon]|nr:MAG: hypothetical protein DRJ25_03750 [Candidatus Woesearchaeota archaeon]